MAPIKKLAEYGLIAIGTAFFLGLLVWGGMESFIPGCKCTLEHCKGCGALGDLLGRIVVMSSAFGGMGLVLVLWCSPFILVFLIARALYRRMTGSSSVPAGEANSTADALSRIDRR